MAGELTRDEVVTVVDRVLRGVIEGEEAEAWLALCERSLGVPRGRLVGAVVYPEESGLSSEAGASEIVAWAEGWRATGLP